MKIYKLAANELLFYHATIPQFAEEIVKSGIIKPSSELKGYQGWNWSTSELGHEYGDVVYLANDQVEAISYASMRLRKLWSEHQSSEDLYDEDMRFVGLFKVYINVNSPKIKPSKSFGGEYIYFGSIPKNPNNEAFWVGPEWISKESEADAEIARIEKVNKEWEI